MFFYGAKIFWFLVQPLNLALFLLLTGLALRLVSFRRLGGLFAWTAALVLFVGVWSSLGVVALQPLEDRYKRPDPAPATIAGIIVLGGGMEGQINLARGGYELNSSGDRFVETAVLARRFPEARIVVSGGIGALLLPGEADADTALRLFTALGVSPQRLILENKSRDTYENALFSKEMVQPGPGETWLLVTSAFHMPRSMALFRKAGFDVLPWPVDYRTAGDEGVGLFTDNAIDSLQATTLGLREWIGLIAYWLSGRIDSPFPGPI